MVPLYRNPSDPWIRSSSDSEESPSDPVTASSGHDHRNSGPSVGVCDPNGSRGNRGDSSAGALPIGRPDREGLPLGGSDETQNEADPPEGEYWTTEDTGGTWLARFGAKFPEPVDSGDPSDPYSSAFTGKVTV